MITQLLTHVLELMYAHSHALLCTLILISYHLTNFLGLLPTQTMEQICVDVALCNRTSEATAASALSSVKSVGGEVTCELCKIAISALHQVFSEASIEVLFEPRLFCKDVGIQFISCM